MKENVDLQIPHPSHQLNFHKQLHTVTLYGVTARRTLLPRTTLCFLPLSAAIGVLDTFGSVTGVFTAVHSISGVLCLRRVRGVSAAMYTRAVRADSSRSQAPTLGSRRLAPRSAV